MKARLDHAEKWATVSAAIIAALALIATAIFSSLTLTQPTKR